MERRAELAGELEISKLRRLENEATVAGNPARAAAMRAAAEAREDVRTRVDAGRVAESAAATPGERSNYVEASVRESREARAAARSTDERDRAQGRERALANQNSSVAAIEAERLRLTGHSDAAKLTEEKAARAQDELDRKEARQKYRGMGFTDKDADNAANKDIKTNQVDRFLSSLSKGMGTVIADSMAKIGGGGGVAGIDPAVDELEKVRGLLEEIRDQSKKTVTLEIKP